MTRSEVIRNSLQRQSPAPSCGRHQIAHFQEEVSIEMIIVYNGRCMSLLKIQLINAKNISKAHLVKYDRSTISIIDFF